MCKWLDKKSVVMESNFLSIGECYSVRRWNAATKSHIQVPRPEVIKEYNATMGVVNFYNRLISFYRIKIKSKKRTLRLIFHAVDIEFTNSWLEYKMLCDVEIQKKEFLIFWYFECKLQKR